MTNYTINHIEVDGRTYWVILNNDSMEYFNGYDFMGSVNWTTNQDECYWMNREEAIEIARDLNLADEPAEPETKRENVGYEIIQSVRLDAKHEIVIGKHPTAPASYVCWDCTNGDDYNNGGYCITFRQALLVMAERIQNRYDFLPVEY